MIPRPSRCTHTVAKFPRPFAMTTVPCNPVAVTVTLVPGWYTEGAAMVQDQNV